MTDADIVDGVIAREVGPAVFQELVAGKRVNAVHRDPADRGGTTNMGITVPALSRQLGRPATDADVSALAFGQAREYYRWLMESYGLDSSTGLLPELRALFLDIVTNHGSGVRILQRALGVTVDGVYGRRTREAFAAADPYRLFRELGAQRLEYVGRLISDQLHDDDHDGIPDNTEQAAGWLARHATFWRMSPCPPRM